MAAAVHVKGLTDLSRAFKAAGREAQKEMQGELREVAEPIRRDAESLAAGSITKIGPKWSAMRVGVTTRVVYVAPKARGIKGRGVGGMRRPNLAPLLMERALAPALDRNAAAIERAAERALGNIGRHWENR